MPLSVVSLLRSARLPKSRVPLALVGLVGLGQGLANAQTMPAVRTKPVFNDDFSSSTLNRMNWNPTDRYQGIQRTRWSNTPTFGKDADGTTYARLNLDSYHPDPAHTGVNFLGTQLTSLPRFKRGAGLEFEARLRSNNMPAGIVEAFFAYGDAGTYKDTYQKSETDFEFITLQGGNKIWLNVWDDWNPLRLGPASSSLTATPANWNNNTWNTYKIRWYTNRTEWIVNDRLIRKDSSVVPGSPMGVWLNIWAADSGWSDAYSANLKPAKTPAENKRYSFDVDYVRVRPIPQTSTAVVVGTGTGLSGYYYDNIDFWNYRFARVDPRINFDWGNYPPDPRMGPDSFSVRWKGTIQAQFNETYTFTANAGDAVRVWVNNKLIIDNWKDNYWPVATSGKIALTAGAKVPIRIDYYEHTEKASVQLFWSSPSTSKRLVPQSQLYPENQPKMPTFSPAPGTYSSAQNVTISSNSTGAVIRYTVDGSPPSESSPAIAPGATVRIGTDTVLRARVFVEGRIPSDTRTGQYLFSYKDTAGPTMVIKSPAANTSVSGLSSVTGTATDTLSGVSRVDLVIKRLSDGFRWTGSTWINQEYGVKATLNGSNWTVDSNLPSGSNLPPGQYELKSVGYDFAGNVGVKAHNISVGSGAAGLSAAQAEVVVAEPSQSSQEPTAVDVTPSKAPSASEF